MKKYICKIKFKSSVIEKVEVSGRAETLEEIGIDLDRAIKTFTPKIEVKSILIILVE